MQSSKKEFSFIFQILMVRKYYIKPINWHLLLNYIKTQCSQPDSSSHSQPLDSSHSPEHSHSHLQSPSQLHYSSHEQGSCCFSWYSTKAFSVACWIMNSFSAAFSTFKLVTSSWRVKIASDNFFICWLTWLIRDLIICFESSVYIYSSYILDYVISSTYDCYYWGWATWE